MFLFWMNSIMHLQITVDCSQLLFSGQPAACCKMFMRMCRGESPSLQPEWGGEGAAEKLGIPIFKGQAGRTQDAMEGRPS
jgi:hypothetical protein